MQFKLTQPIDDSDPELIAWLRRGNVKEALNLLNSCWKGDVHEEDHYQNQAIHYATALGDENVVTGLLDRGAGVNAKSFFPYEWTPLIIATCHGHEELVGLLLKHRADPNIADERGFTALTWAVSIAGRAQVSILRALFCHPLLREATMYGGNGSPGIHDVLRRKRADARTGGVYHDSALEKVTELIMEFTPLS
jgi:ankyrin repeat protein